MANYLVKNFSNFEEEISQLTNNNLIITTTQEQNIVPIRNNLRIIILKLTIFPSINFYYTARTIEVFGEIT